MPDISVPKGAKRQHTFPVTQGRGGPAYDLTGAEVEMTAKHRTDDLDADAVWTKTVGSGLTVADPTSGLVVLTITPADTADLEPHTALVYDVWVTEPDSDPYLAAKGRVFITPRVSSP